MARIGKYNLEGEIGRGGFGRVFKAFDPTVGRTVAIKILITDKDKDLLARFRREATATGKLRHKNIVTVYEYGEEDNTPYLVMEYLEGEDLKTSFAAGHLSTLLDKASIMSQVAEGLQHAHHHEIVHRDIKPANIMILSDGTAKIMDFGIARVLSELTTRLTRHGDVLGTLSYMAPEVLQGTDVDALCDIFSFGVIYYELIAGKHPFTADQPARVIYNITSLQPPPVSALAPDCPPDLDQLISRAMHKDRELRYQSFEDLLFDLMPIRLQLQSVEAQNLIRKAETLVNARQIREAQTVVRQILQLDPNNTLARELRERVNREAQLQATRERCQQLMNSGTEQFNSQQYSKAIESFETVLRLDPNHAEAKTLHEQVRTAVRKRDRAEALIVQAKRELEADQVTDAYRSILESLQYAPENKEAMALLETVRAAIKARERQRRLMEGVTRVEGALKDGQPEEAETQLSDLELSYSTAPMLRQLRREVTAALEEKRRRQQLAETLTTVRKVCSEKKWADAIELLSRTLKEFPDEEEVRSLSAYAQEQLELQRRAEHIEQLVRDATSANERHDFDSAFKLIQDGLRSYPGETSLKTMLARTEELRYEHQRRVAIEAARHRVAELAAKNDFSAAIAVIDSTATTWKSDELEGLRKQIETKQEEFLRAQAIAKAGKAVKAYIDRGRFEEAVTACREALTKFPKEPSLSVLLETAQERLAEQKRKARIKAISDDAATAAAENRFADALELLRNGIGELGDEPSIKALHERIQVQQKEHERQQAIAAATTNIEALVDKADYEEAVRFGRSALKKFPGEVRLSKLVEAAEVSLAQQRRTRRISSVLEEAQSLASKKDFQSALQLLHDTIHELGPDSSIEELARSVESLRQEHEKQEAIRTATELAKQMMDSKEYAKAIAILEQSLERYPRETTVANLLASARDEFARQQRAEAIDAVLAKARELVQRQELQAALNLVRSNLKEYPDDDRLTSMAADLKAAILEREKERAIKAALDGAAVLQEKGEFSKAAQLLEHTLVKAPQQTAIIEALALVRGKITTQQKVNTILDNVCELMSREKFDEALESVRDALNVFPGELALSSLLEEVKQAQHAQALAAAVQGIEDLRSTGDLDKAAQRLQDVLKTFPDEPSLGALKSRLDSEIAEQKKRENLSTVTTHIRQLLDREKVDDAIVKLKDVLRTNPGEGELTALYAYANEIVEARQQVDEVSSLVKKVKILLQTGRPGEAEELLKGAVNRYPDEETFSPLLEQARAAISAQQAAKEQAAKEQAAKEQAASPPIASKVEIPLQIPGPPKTKGSEPVALPAPGTGPRVPARRRSSPLPPFLLGAVILIGLLAWVLLRPGTDYQDQLKSARSYFEQKDFGKATELLQQIPSGSSAYKEAQELLTSVRDGEEQRNTEVLLAQATELHKQNRDDDSLATIQKLLEADSSNQAALSLRDEIEKSRYLSKSRAEQDQFVRETLTTAQALFNAGDLQAAKGKVGEILRLRADEPGAVNLNRRIDVQLDASRKMNEERSNLAQAKAEAEKANASALDATRFAAAQTAEEAALRQQQARQFESATKKFAEAAGLYNDSAKAAVDVARRAEEKKKADADAEAAAILLRRNQAETARTQYQQNLAKARGAGAESKAGDRFLAAARLASDAQDRFDKNDFAGARGGFEQASSGMVQAADAAIKADQAASDALTATARRNMETARAEMDSAKRTLTARDAQASAEEGRALQLTQEGKLADAASAYQAAASLYRAAAQRESEQRDINAIRTALDQYRAAYERKDMDSMKGVFPTMSAAEEGRVRETMRNARTIQVKLDPPTTTVSGDTASAETRMQFTFRATIGNQTTTTPQDSVVFNLRRRGGAWVIESIAR